jgi:hypothetical protein
VGQVQTWFDVFRRVRPADHAHCASRACVVESGVGSLSRLCLSTNTVIGLSQWKNPAVYLGDMPCNPRVENLKVVMFGCRHGWM